MAAGAAQAQVHPPVAGRKTLLAALGRRRDRLDGFEMCAFGGHVVAPN